MEEFKSLIVTERREFLVIQSIIFEAIELPAENMVSGLALVLLYDRKTCTNNILSVFRIAPVIMN